MPNVYDCTNNSCPLCKGCYKNNINKARKLPTTTFFVMEALLENEEKGINKSAKEFIDDISIHIGRPNAYKIFTKITKLGRVVKDKNPIHAISYIPKLTSVGKECLKCYKNPHATTECNHPLVESEYLGDEILI